MFVPSIIMVDSGDEDIYKTTFKLYRNWTPESNLPLIDFTVEKNYKNYFNFNIQLLFDNFIWCIDSVHALIYQ